MISNAMADLAHWRLAVSSVFPLLFLPLNLALPLLLSVLRGWPNGARRFWLRVFAVNFVLGWLARVLWLVDVGVRHDYLAHYAGEAWFLPAALDVLSSAGLALFLFRPFLAAERLPGLARAALSAAFCLVLHLSAFWQLKFYFWRFNPLGVVFNPQTYRLELSDIDAWFGAPWLQALAGFLLCYGAAGALLAAVSAGFWARRPWDMGARFGLNAGLGAGALCGVLLAALWTAGGPAVADQAGLQDKLRAGVTAFQQLQVLRDDNPPPEVVAAFEHSRGNLGYAWLLKRWTEHVEQASEALLEKATASMPPFALSKPLHAAACALAGVAGLLCAGLWSARRAEPVLALRLTGFALLAWLLAGATAWMGGEAALSPWALAGLLPSFLSVSSLNLPDVAFGSGLAAVLYLGVLAGGGWLWRRFWLDWLEETA